MAHPIEVQAKCLAMLMLGDSPRYVAKKTGVPLTTVKRWRNNEMRQWMREIFGPEVKQSIMMALRKGGPIKMAPKKGIR